MASGNKQILLCSTVISGNGCTTGNQMSLRARAKAETMLLTVSCYTDGTYTLQSQHSPDGNFWENIGCCAALSANGIITIALPHQQLSLVRTIVTATGVTCGATIQVDALTDVASKVHRVRCSVSCCFSGFVLVVSAAGEANDSGGTKGVPTGITFNCIAMALATCAKTSGNTCVETTSIWYLEVCCGDSGNIVASYCTSSFNAPNLYAVTLTNAIPTVDACSTIFDDSITCPFELTCSVNTTVNNVIVVTNVNANRSGCVCIILSSPCNSHILDAQIDNCAGCFRDNRGAIGHKVVPCSGGSGTIGFGGLRTRGSFVMVGFKPKTGLTPTLANIQTSCGACICSLSICCYTIS